MTNNKQTSYAFMPHEHFRKLHELPDAEKALPIEVLKLGKLSYQKLIQNNVHTMEQLAKHNRASLLELKGIGSTMASEIILAFAKFEYEDEEIDNE